MPLFAAAEQPAEVIYPPGRAKLAECLSASGVRYFGASWCPQCRRQNQMFGDAVRRLRYIECSADGTRNKETRVCAANNIQGYPTWVFANGVRRSGVQSLKTLAQLSGCD